jgi:hypothetical protein
MSFTEKPPVLPPPDVPMIAPGTGLITPPWREYLTKLVAWLQRMGAAIP